MIGAQQPQQPGFPSMPPQDPEALLAYAEATAAYARWLQRMAPQSQHHAQQQLPVHGSYAVAGSKQSDDAKAVAAEPRSSSLRTIIVCLFLGAVGGVACDRSMRAAGDEGRRDQQQQEQKLSR